MELIRDLLRDLVGVIFPGGLFVIFTLWLFFGILIILMPSDVFTVYSIGDKSVSFLTLLIFSYIAGQSLRIKQLNQLEKACTETYRKKRIKNESGLSEKNFEESVKTLDKVEEDYYAGRSTLDRLVEVYKQHNDKFRIWEEFPYPYLLRGRRLLLQSKGYIQFFEKYDKQGITKDQYFFNFCKSVIYEYSPSLKEELIRQEALVRLFAGIYYVLKYGKFAGAITLLLHSAIVVAFYYTGSAPATAPTATSRLCWPVPSGATLPPLLSSHITSGTLCPIQPSRISWRPSAMLWIGTATSPTFCAWKTSRFFFLLTSTAPQAGRRPSSSGLPFVMKLTRSARPGGLPKGWTLRTWPCLMACLSSRLPTPTIPTTISKPPAGPSACKSGRSRPASPNSGWRRSAPAGMTCAPAATPTCACPTRRTAATGKMAPCTGPPSTPP